MEFLHRKQTMNKDAQRFVLWSRLGVHVLILFMGVGFPVIAHRYGFEGELRPTLLVTLLLFVAAVPSMVAVERQPNLNLTARGQRKTWTTLAYVGCATLFIMGLVIAPHTPVGSVLAIGAATIAASSTIPWSKADIIQIVIVTLALMWLADTEKLLYGLPVMTYLVVISTGWWVTTVKNSERTRHLESALKVSDERLRFAQELHDTVGQHLAAMSVKAELARALVARGDSRADAELEELQALTKTTAKEMRQVVEGYRTADLAKELDGARSLLEQAGIGLHINGTTASLEKHQELAAWFIRETTTNILKHSHATDVSIELSGSGVRIVNDGADNRKGNLGGLRALQHRAEQEGCRIDTDQRGNTFETTLMMEHSHSHPVRSEREVGESQ